MRSILRAVAAGLAALGMGIVCQPAVAQEKAPPKPQADVPVKMVVLFSSGVGYFEHVGSVKGDSTAELRFKTQQINDILKSLVLDDMGKGKVTAVVYPSQDPISKTLKSFQIDITSNPSLAQLLGQLRGAKVKLAVATEQLEGTILGIESRNKPAGDKNTVQVPVLNLITAGGAIRAVELEQVSKLELQDPQLQEELGKALAALAQARDQDKKPITINFTGEGERQVRVGYVVETPVWKSSYRLLLNVDPKDKPKLQGWAIVENQTDSDWNNVQLSLVSGRPISFIQDLYTPQYIPRPIVQPELYASLRPQTYEGGMPGDGKERLAAATDAPAPARPGAAAKAPAGGRGGGMGGGSGGGAFGVSADKDEAYAPMDPSRSVASVASASKIGELFQYTVGNVVLPRQKSAMIPIVTDDVEVERVSIYNASVLPRNPLNGARLKNTTGKHLLAGPITVLDGSSYAGDAKIDNVPPNQERLLSYGIDLQMLVDATKNGSTSAIRTGKIVKGVLELTHKFEYTQDYIAQNKAEKDKVLIVEHPRRGSEIKLIAPEKPAEMTDAVYRFRLPVPAGKEATLNVKEEQIQSQTIAILGTDTSQLEFYTRNDRIPTKVRDALTEAMKRKSALVDSQRKVAELRQQKADIMTEQVQVRENLKAVPANDQLHNRLLTTMNEQLTAIAKINTDIDDTNKAIKKQQKELEDYLANLSIE